MTRTRRMRRLRRAVAELIADLLDDGHDLDTIAIHLELLGVPLNRAAVGGICRESEMGKRFRYLEAELAKVRASLDRLHGLNRAAIELGAAADRR